MEPSRRANLSLRTRGFVSEDPSCGKVEMHVWQRAVVGAQQGSLAAFDQLVRSFQHMAVGYAYSILGDFQLAEDAAQEAFLQAYQDLRMLKAPEAFPAWLRRIVAKQCDRAVRRRRLVTVPLEASVDLADPGQGPFESVQQQETRQEVLTAIGNLPEQERVTTTLFYIDGYSLAEVGGFLEVPVGTIKRRLHSARNRLRERMLAMAADTIRQHAPGDEFGARVRKVLEGIERIHWQSTSCLCFVGSAVVTLRYLGEQAPSDYVMGVSGGAFSSYWGMPWFDANSDLLFIGEEPIRRTFSTFGYDYSLVLPDPGQKRPGRAKPRFQQAIVASIDAGRPVIALGGLAGPPEASVIAGYDEGGDVLYGWSYFQQDPSRYQRSEAWADQECFGLILVGEKQTPPSPPQVLTRTLEWAVRLAHTEEFLALPLGISTPRGGEPRLRGGLAAFDAFAEALRRDADFPPGNLEVLTSRLVPITNDGIWLVKCKRESAARYLRSVADEQGLGQAELRAAAEAYDQEVAVWKVAQGMTCGCHAPPEERLKIADSKLRRELSRLVLEAKAHEARAVQHLEEAYTALSR